MREMKFRAWNITTKRMVDLNAVTPLALDPAFNGQLEGVFVPFKDGYEIMQFTGLLDKSSKEIYEGDVVSITNPLYQIQKARLIGVVGFSWAAFHVEIKRTVEWELYNVDAPELMFLMNIANSKEITVVGNIYENPELLEAK